MIRDVVIVGSGLAGMYCASELASLGFNSIIVDEAAAPGGHVASLSCKAHDSCRKCGACSLEDILARIRNNNKISMHLGTSLQKVSTSSGKHSLSFSSLNQPVLSTCNNCEECLKVCPQPGAIIRSPFHGHFIIDHRVCSAFSGSDCRECIGACVNDSIRFGGIESFEAETSAVIIATGFKPADPSEKARFGYGRVVGVYSGLELESMLRNNNSPFGESSKIAFIQCVGSRDIKLGRNYCSQICCAYALRTSNLLRKRHPGLKTTIFYMDLQSIDRELKRFSSDHAAGLELIRSIPSEIRTGVDGKPEAVFTGPSGRRQSEQFDAVILSIGIAPSQKALEPALKMGLYINRDGFAYSPKDSPPGIFACGTLKGPKSIPDTISDAIQTASQAADFLKIRSGGLQ